MRRARNSPRRPGVAPLAWPQTLLAWPAFALACCGPATSEGPSEGPPASTVAAPAVAVTVASPWHYAPALAAAIPPGSHAEPVLELADGLHGHARIVVAVAEAESPARIEVWDFSQNNDKGLLARRGPPQILLALAASPADARWDRDAAAALHREIAGPGNETVRPLGLPGEPAALLPELARLAAATTQGDAATRTHALAEFTRGLDERLLLARLPELLRRFQSPTWTLDPPVTLGPRRVKISGRDGEHTVQLELTRTQLGAAHGWILSDLSEPSDRTGRAQSPSSAAAAPAADPSPTAP